MKFRFHVPGFPHTATSKHRFLHCGYTQKCLNFCKMMVDQGHTVYHYGGEGSDVECTEHIQIVSEAERDGWFKSDWDRGDFPDMEFNPSKPYWQTFNSRTVMEVHDRIQPGDFICLITGGTQKCVADAFPNNSSVEYGVGYEGISLPFRCFESRAWQHHVYGLYGIRNGVWYDTVIGNYYDPADFPMGERKGDYFLFLGRLIQRKLPHVAADVCGRIGAKLLIAGQGVTLKEPGKIYSRELCVVGGHVEHVGVVDVKRRAELLGNAKALFVMTQYIAPFEGVHIEANLCGCPVIVTDWGVFPETVENGVNGYRVRTMGEAMWAAKHVENLDPVRIRTRALTRFSLEAAAPQYEEWFNRIHGLRVPGHDWYDQSPGRFG